MIVFMFLFVVFVSVWYIVQCRVCSTCLLSYADFKEQTIGFCLALFGFVFVVAVSVPFGSVKPLTFKNPIMRSGSYVCDYLLMIVGHLSMIVGH